MKNILITFIACLFFINGYSQSKKYSLNINTDKTISSFNKSMLLGTNIGIYYEEEHLLNFKMLSHLHNLNPGIMRMPGGSWSNELYWNGNRIRISEESYIEGATWQKIKKEGGNPMKVAFDTTRYKNEKWDVDYSGYASGFRIENNEHTLSDFHGFTDILFLHKYIQSFGCETMVTVNMGTGTAEMAAEWVKWVKERQYYARKPFAVKYWEMGNELDGDWEVGHFLPDGSKMNAKEYVRRYKLFAEAMKKADPEIKIGGSVASNMHLPFIEELIKETQTPIDFISFHAYPSHDTLTNFEAMAKEAVKVNEAVKKINNWLSKYRPQEKDKIEIAVTEWNIKVKEDITTVDITNALWSAVMIGEMARAGVDIAIQWDLFSTTETGGHGLFNPKDKEMKPRSQYWATYLWSNFMGNKLVETKLNAPDHVYSYTTLDDDYVSIMIINGSASENVSIEVEFPYSKKKFEAQEILFSNEQYRINSKTLIPEISTKPEIKVLRFKKKQLLDIKPNSIKIIRYTKPKMKS